MTEELGGFEVPVAIGALVRSAGALFVLVASAEAFVPVTIVVGLLVAGGFYFLWLLISNREALDTEPGDVDVLKH
jgi:ABC-type enterobactin transport system permease subunit